MLGVVKHLLHLLDYHTRPTGKPWLGQRVETPAVRREPDSARKNEQAPKNEQRVAGAG